MSSKKSKSFADALLAADIETEKIAKVKKLKPKIIEKTKNSGCKPSRRDSGTSKESHEKSNIRHSQKRKSEGDKPSSSNSRKFKESSTNSIKKKQPKVPFDDLSTSELDSIDITPATANQPFDRSKYGAGQKNTASKGNKLVAKLLAEEEERRQNTLMLKSVEEELELFDNELENEEELEMQQEDDVKVPLLPSGIVNVHSLRCHNLYSLDKVQWPFTTSWTGKEKLSGVSTPAVFNWLVSLEKSSVSDILLRRTLMERELELQVVNRLVSYLIRYLAASALKQRSAAANRTDSVEVRAAAYQLVLYYVSVTSNPQSLLQQCMSEIPLALVNIGCDTKCFPTASFERWKLTSLHHNHNPNSATDNIEQISTMQQLLSILCTCVDQTVSCCNKTDGNQQKTNPNLQENQLDDLVTWLVVLAQDPKIISSTLHTIIASTVGHALELYKDFTKKVQDLVERISVAWFESFSDSQSNDSECLESSCAAFPHHTASYVCSTVLSTTSRSRMLASSLAFVALEKCLECEDLEVLDYVEMKDILVLLASQKSFLVQKCDLYRLRSVLLLLDTCVTEVLMNEPTRQKMMDFQKIYEFVQVDCAWVLAGGDGTQGGSSTSLSHTRNRTQLTGLKTALLQKWEKMMHMGETVYTADGLRAVPGSSL